MAKTHILDIYMRYYAPDSEVKYTPKLEVGDFVVLLSLDPTACPPSLNIRGRRLKGVFQSGNISKQAFLSYCDTLVKGKYLQWLIDHRAEIVVDCDDAKLDNSERVTEALFWFDYNKPYLTEKQINQYTVAQLFELYEELQHTDLRLLHEIGKANAKDAELVYFDEDWALVIPKTFEASCYYGQFTKWCTTERKNPSLFYNYSKKGPLYILIERHGHHKYQLYFVEGEYDFRDEEDVSVYPWDIPMSEGAKNYLLKISGLRGYTTELINRILEWGAPPERVFDQVNEEHDGFCLVKIDMRYNFMDKKRYQLVGDTWYYFAMDYSDGKARVWNMRFSSNYLDTQNHLVFEEWRKGDDAWNYSEFPTKVFVDPVFGSNNSLDVRMEVDRNNIPDDNLPF